MITINAVSISEKKGTKKVPVETIELNELGIIGDAHAGNWHRQVSLLGQESITRFQSELGRKIEQGEFAENITTNGMELYEAMPLDRFICGTVILEVTQIGKKCHGNNCAIFQQVGSCVMPKEGIFCKVISNGYLKANDVLEYYPYKFRAKVITLSDRASKGEYEDKSGPLLQQKINDIWISKKRTGSIDLICIPDDSLLLKKELQSAIDLGYDYIFTTGGTGIGPRDITVNTVKPFIEKEIPGIMEFIRVKYGEKLPQALLSRSIAGVSNQSLIYTLPGSVGGVNDYMNEIEKTLEHAFFMLKGIDIH